MNQKTALDYQTAIRNSGKNIYTPIPVGDADYWIPDTELEILLNRGLNGLNLSGLANRTRSKVLKTAVCNALGYPVPSSFQKIQPRFLGQQLDIYGQKSLNLQIWNEELSATRRYALIQISDDDIVLKVKVVDGQTLARLDTTGTITKKYQATIEVSVNKYELISAQDTVGILPFTGNTYLFHVNITPVDQPTAGLLLPIQEIFQRLCPLIGQSFPDPGRTQERNRGAALHQLVCHQLGYSNYSDNGQFPDVLHQLLEVKLQTARTIDLGLVLPNSQESINIEPIVYYQPRHCDTRYAVFYAQTDGINVTLTHLILTTGEDFFTRFSRFEGNVTNGKIQIPLPRDFFN